jgi:hypothetical protein
VTGVPSPVEITDPHVARIADYQALTDVELPTSPLKQAT